MNIEIKISGEYRVQVFNDDMSEKFDSGFFDNILTDGYFDRLAGRGATVTAASLLSYCAVGSGTATPAASDTGITQVGARAGSTQNPSASESARVLSMQHTYVFPASAVVGTVAEVGLFADSTGGNVNSRTLIKDVVGTPTTITLIAGDTLWVTYKMTVAAPSADITGVCSISGVDYNYTMRPSLLTYALPGPSSLNFSPWLLLFSSSQHMGFQYALVYATQTLGAYTATPSGSVFLSAPSPGLSAYTTGTYTRQLLYSFTLAQGNTGSGIGSIVFAGDTSSATAPGWQVSFAAVSGGGKIPKDSTKTFSIRLNITYSR